MKRKIIILAIDEEIAIFFKEELLSIFGSSLDINYYTTSSNSLTFIHDADLIIYTDPSILIEFMSRIKSQCPVLMMKRTISKHAVHLIQQIPKNSCCLVSNINSFMANETLTTIYQLGFRDILLYPFYEGKTDLPDKIDYVISPEDYNYLDPLKCEKIIIGNRIFDINTVLDILALLDISSDAAEDIIIKYSLKIPDMWKGLNYALQNRRILSSQWKILLDELSFGVIVIDDKNRISLVNSHIHQLFGPIFDALENKPLANLIAIDNSFETLLTDHNIENELFVYNNTRFILTIKQVTHDRNYYGQIILLREYAEIVKVQQKIHNKIIGKGYYSNYHFDSIIGNDEKIKDCIEISKKIAPRSGVILITGESGTGKELFAGAIHNYSNRSHQPFVAINCAALPHNLLESELFGYEDGAFTGAKKGGKIGLFESANNGTLFLDEIGEIPLDLQARLLRVLQEKEIMKIGGDSIIKINTRIIAATNKNLFQMVEKGDFRGDLFFRLNIFQVDIPPLRERGDDVALLTKHFLKSLSNTKAITTPFLEFCKHYEWNGNVRELYNILEYTLTVSEKELSPEFLPSYLKQKKYLNFKMNEIELFGSDVYTLRSVYSLNNTGQNSGRRSLTRTFTKKYYALSEIDMRGILEKLESQELITISKGPTGCEISEKGLLLLKKLNYEL